MCVIARSVAPRQSRNAGACNSGLLRSARNDGLGFTLRLGVFAVRIPLLFGGLQRLGDDLNRAAIFRNIPDSRRWGAIIDLKKMVIQPTQVNDVLTVRPKCAAA